MTSKRKQKDLTDPSKLKLAKNRSERNTKPSKFDPLLALVGSGRDLWADEHADEYVARLRKGWE